MTKSPKYPPELMEPIFVGALYTYTYGVEATRDKILSDRMDKLKLLMKHFGIDERHSNPFLILAFELARNHIKGFDVASTPPRRAGRPRSRDPLQMYELFKEVAALKESGMTVNAACQSLTKRKLSQWHGKNWRTLANRWRETKKEIDTFESGTGKAYQQLAGAYAPGEIDRLKDVLPRKAQQKSRQE